MRVAQMAGGIVVATLEFPDTMRVAADGLSVEGEATATVHGDDGDVKAVSYPARFDAPQGFTLALMDDAAA